jgi:hypothetical protein
LSRLKIFKLLSPIMFLHLILVVLPLIEVIPRFVISILQAGAGAYTIHFIFVVLEAFSSSWASEFEHVEGERDHAMFVNDELQSELHEKDIDMDKDVQNMRESIGETRHTVEGALKEADGEDRNIDHQELVRRVVKLDEKIAMASEARECRQLVAQLSQRGARALISKWIQAKELMEMVKRMSICKCTLTNEQLTAIKVNVDARALRIICHNFTTFARKHEDAQSSYKAFATVDINLPQAAPKKTPFMSIVEVKVKFMGLPLSEEEIQTSEEKAARIMSR